MKTKKIKNTGKAVDSGKAVDTPRVIFTCGVAQPGRCTPLPEPYQSLARLRSRTHPVGESVSLPAGSAASGNWTPGITIHSGVLFASIVASISWCDTPEKVWFWRRVNMQETPDIPKESALEIGLTEKECEEMIKKARWVAIHPSGLNPALPAAKPDSGTPASSTLVPARREFTPVTGTAAGTGYQGRYQGCQNNYNVGPPPISPKSVTKMAGRFDVKKLRLRCRQTIPQIFQEVVSRGGEVVGVPGQQYAYKNNGASVLVVAHCDWVQSCKQQFGVLKLGGEHLIYSPQLDDRLGVYTILDLLPALNIRADILLTEGEETGRTTAKLFQTEKKYKWLVEFDRRGTDAVTYRYKDPDWEAALKQNFRLGHGTFSDISAMEFLGVCAFNVGIAYTGEHSNNCHMNVEEYCAQMVRFREFWKTNHRKTFPHRAAVSKWDRTSGHGTGGRGAWGGYADWGNETPAQRGVAGAYGAYGAYGDYADDGYVKGMRAAARAGKPPVAEQNSLPVKKRGYAFPESGETSISPAPPNPDTSCTRTDCGPPSQCEVQEEPADPVTANNWDGGTANPALYECSECLELFSADEAPTVDLLHVQCPQCGAVLLMPVDTDPEDLGEMLEEIQ